MQTIGRIADVGRRHLDAVKQISHLRKQVEDQRKRAEDEFLRAKQEASRAEDEVERARHADKLRAESEKKADNMEAALGLSQKAVARLEAELAETKAAKEIADSKRFEAGKEAGLAEYVDQVSRFENRGFKHGWHKALAAAGVSLNMPIPYEQVDIDPLETDSEG